ncbi:hypothetical protein B0H14DRAFT_2580482 [Mycena olivaceomarginata]|nr:hypothetical protein B0H14DRAFT_2580482 [Mycena olivaceomarginata]
MANDPFQHPVCGNCTRLSKEEPCKFTDPLSRINLQYHSDNGNNMAGGSGFPSHGGMDEFHGHSPPGVNFLTPASSSSEVYPDAQFESLSNDSCTEEPPFETIQLLLECFLPHAVQFGFFLNVERFRNSSLVPQIPFGDILGPSRSLLSAVYLWGAHLFQSGPLFELKPLFLNRALQSVSAEMCVPTDSVYTIQTIQAHILLANYFFLHNRFLMAQLHANAAATLALGYRLHRLGSTLPSASPIHHVDISFDAYLPPAQDSVEEGERVRCFWAIVSLQANLNLASGSPTCLSSCLLECLETEINTPWPMKSSEYEPQSGYLSTDNGGEEATPRFQVDGLHGIPFSAQASVLLHRASRCAEKWSSDLSPTELASYMNCYAWLNGRITQFWDGLPPVYRSTDADLVLTHALVAGASIKLHQPFEMLESAALMKAARAILRILHDTTSSTSTPPHANPVIGTICALACSVFVNEIQRTRQMWAEWAQTLDVDVLPVCEQESTLLLNFQDGIRILEMLAAGNPLAVTGHQLGKIQQQYNSLSVSVIVL